MTCAAAYVTRTLVELQAASALREMFLGARASGVERCASACPGSSPVGARDIVDSCQGRRTTLDGERPMCTSGAPARRLEVTIEFNKILAKSSWAPQIANWMPSHTVQKSEFCCCSNTHSSSRAIRSKWLLAPIQVMPVSHRGQSVLHLSND